MTLVRKILSNTAWQVFGKAVTAILGIVSIKFITNYLSRGTYGEYTTIYDFTALFAIIADFGLFTIAVREMAHAGEKKMVEKILGNILSLRTMLAFAALGIGILAALFIPAYRGSHIPLGVAIVSGATMLTLVASTMASVLQYYLQMAWVSIALSLGKLITVFYILATILYLHPQNPDAGFPHLLLAWIIGALATIVITYAASSRLVKVSFQFDVSFWKTVLMKALPYGLALVLGTIYFRMGTITLSVFQLQDDVGYYGVPLRFLEILQIIPHYFMNSVLPVLTVSLKEGGEKSRRILRYSLSALAGVAFPLFVGGYLLAWPIVAAVSSPDFLTHRAVTGELIYGSDMALKLLLAACVFTYLHVALSYTLVAMERQKELLWINAVVVVINVVLNFSLSPVYGFIGAATSALVAELVMFVLLVARVRAQIRDVWDLPFLGKIVFSSLIMGIALWFAAPPLMAAFKSASLLILIPMGAAIFAVSAWLTKTVSPELLATLRKTGPSVAGETTEWHP